VVTDSSDPTKSDFSRASFALNIPRMGRILLLSLWSISILLCGCAPKDPLDRKVKAGTPAEFARWWDRTREKLPDEQRAEVFKVIRYLQDSTPRLKAMRADDHYDPLCKKIDGISIRRLLVLGYENSNDNLQSRILLETGKLPQLVTAISESDDPVRREYTDSVLRYTRERIDDWKATIAENDRRIAQLIPSAAQP
jgi:hypothetical protein